MSQATAASVARHHEEPSQVIHASRSTNDDGAWLVDGFASPRRDFSDKPGMVDNAADYPMRGSLWKPQERRCSADVT